MERIIVQPPVLGGAALAELKHWLGISRPAEDAALTGLLEASHGICEAFIGKSPLMQTVEEVIALVAGWQELTARPVRDVTGAALIATDGSRQTLPIPGDTFELRIADTACVRLLRPLEGRGVALRLVIGIAEDWEQVPAPLRHGIIRLAAHHYRDRDRDTKDSVAPPASVTALWRPWRTVRIA
jgi:uncharacterized phiE125 gp8 family phage protein